MTFRINSYKDQFYYNTRTPAAPFYPYHHPRKLSPFSSRYAHYRPYRARPFQVTPYTPNTNYSFKAEKPTPNLPTRALDCFLSKKFSLLNRALSCATSWILLDRQTDKIAKVCSKIFKDIYLSLTAIGLPKKFSLFYQEAVAFKNDPSLEAARKLFNTAADIVYKICKLIVRLAIFPLTILMRISKVAYLADLLSSSNRAAQEIQSLATKPNLSNKEKVVHLTNFGREAASVALAGFALSSIALAPWITTAHATAELLFSVAGM